MTETRNLMQLIVRMGGADGGTWYALHDKIKESIESLQSRLFESRSECAELRERLDKCEAGRTDGA